MRLIRQVVPNNFNLFLFGDDHSGSLLRYDKGWNMMVDMIHSEYEGVSANYALDHGDVIEAIEVNDPRYDALTTQGNILRQLEDAKQVRVSIAPYLIAILKGNHDAKLWRYCGIEGRGIVDEFMCEPLGVTYGTWSCKVSYVDKKGKPMFKHFATHAARHRISSVADDPQRAQVNMELALKRALRAKAGDTVLMSMGHTHKMLCCEPYSELYLTDDTQTIDQNYVEPDHTASWIHPDQRWYVNTGSFLRLYMDGPLKRTNGEGKEVDVWVDGYAERFGYDPIELGFYVVRVRNRKIEDIDAVIPE